MLRHYRLAIAFVVPVLTPAAASAHTGVGETSGFLHGFAHPLLGLDHLLAMVAVGLLAAKLGGRALWVVPCAFLLAMLGGGVLGTAGVHLPFVEVAIGLSLAAFGAAILLRADIPLVVAAGLVACFAVFHGHSHGAEMPADVPAFGYAAGFLVATALLHGLGVALGAAGARTAAPRLTGGAISIAGLALVAGLF